MVPVFQSFVGLFCDRSGVVKCPSCGGVWNTTVGYFRILLKIFEYVLRLPSETVLLFCFLEDLYKDMPRIILHCTWIAWRFSWTQRPKHSLFLLQLATGHRDRWRFGKKQNTIALKRHEEGNKQVPAFLETTRTIWYNPDINGLTPWCRRPRFKGGGRSAQT